MRVPKKLLLALVAVAVAPSCSRGSEGNPAPSGAAMATAVSPKPAKSSGKDGVQVHVGRGYYDSGDYFVHGEVVNTLDQPIFGPEIEITFQDAQGNTIANGEGATALERIDPGQRAPIMDTHYTAPEGITQVTLKVRRWSSKGTYKPITILESSARAGSFGTVVTGKGRNDTGGPVSGIKLVTTFKDKEGKVMGVHFDYPVNGSLPPGKTFDFTIETMDDAVNGAPHTVQGEGTGPQG